MRFFFGLFTSDTVFQTSQSPHHCADSVRKPNILFRCYDRSAEKYVGVAGPAVRLEGQEVNAALVSGRFYELEAGVYCR